MQFTRHVTLVGCDWQKLETCLDMIPASNASTAAARKTAALKCLPAREELINSTSLLMNALLSSVSSAGCGQRVCFFRHFIYQTSIILPRQARDQDRKVEHEKMVFCRTLGTVQNVMQHTFPLMLELTKTKLEAALGEPLVRTTESLLLCLSRACLGKSSLCIF